MQWGQIQGVKTVIPMRNKGTITAEFVATISRKESFTMYVLLRPITSMKNIVATVGARNINVNVDKK